MPKKEILLYPDKVLKSRAQEIDNIDLDIISLAEDMRRTMHSAPGVGLAAPQVGESKRLIVVDQSAGRDESQLIILINPVIIEKEGVETDTEMCLSVPETSVDVDRAGRILVTGTDLGGKEVRMEAQGYLARIFQHEIDHLDGKVILDYASNLKRSIYLKKRKKGTL
ncbi:MAG TPA: peptide deformylase [Desulfomonilia bacterium]|nr:peptide deformylase [Deltaproteobacteria bacterium]MDI9541319.1 peptide deformylase [Pseudomonadota bacterium]HRR69140.1 peptide deformylase [Desulfomonilia bacterium]